MDFAQLVYKRQHDLQAPKHQDYPKWVGDKIVNSAEEEAALLGASHSEEAASVPESETVENLLSEPKKRRGCPPGGWPKKSTPESEG